MIVSIYLVGSMYLYEFGQNNGLHREFSLLVTCGYHVVPVANQSVRGKIRFMPTCSSLLVYCRSHEGLMTNIY